MLLLLASCMAPLTVAFHEAWAGFVCVLLVYCSTHDGVHHIAEGLSNSVWPAGKEREKLGRCIAGLELLPEPVPAAQEATAGIASRAHDKEHLYSFSRALAAYAPEASQPACSATGGQKGLDACGFELGSSALLSIDGEQIPLK